MGSKYEGLRSCAKASTPEMSNVALGVTSCHNTKNTQNDFQ